MVSIKYYITTAIIYTNAKPHIGFALELIQADMLARFHRLIGDDVFFLTGSDEHGIKNFRAAEAAGKSPQKFVDEITGYVKEMAKSLNISNDDYIRTTDKERHWPTVQAMWNALVKSGDIYKKKYKGYYCAGCESFKLEKELENGLCSLHNRKPEIVEEENYFFKLSKYDKKLIELIESDTYKMIPKERKHEILNFIKKGLEDISFSRSKEALTWGIPVPNDDKQTMYVWCDALTNYLSGVGYTYDKKKFKKYWPADVHVVGKDIIRFHSMFWPAMLLSAGIPLPKQLFIHGFINDAEGKKMSKSLGNVIDPVEQIKKFGQDAFRFYLLKEIPSDNDGNYSEEAMTDKINGVLAGDFGNLVNRVLTLTEKFSESKVPKKCDVDFEPVDIELYKKNIENYNFQEYINNIWKIINHANRYINDEKPWAKEESERQKDLYKLLEEVRVITTLLYPVMPHASLEVLKRLGLGEKDVSAKNLKWGYLKEGTKLMKGNVLFQKIEVKK